MKLIVGLGNPGGKYENTRHNVGFRIASALADRCNIRLNTKAFNSLIGKGRLFAEDIMIALPQTYMNNSGEAVRMMATRRDIEPKDILVICDDVNLSLGTIRIRSNGSSGGHKGLASIIEHLGSGDFARLRIGIGRETRGPELSGYVLSPFRKDETKILESIVESAVECCRAWVEEGPDKAARLFNSKAALKQHGE